MSKSHIVLVPQKELSLSFECLGDGAWPRICSQVFIERLFRGEPISAKLLAFDQFFAQEVANVSWGIPRIIRGLLHRDPLYQSSLLDPTKDRV